jgi:hypothetical protein
MNNDTKRYREVELKAVELNPAPYKRTLQIYGGKEASITKHLAISEQEFQKIKSILIGR